MGTLRRRIAAALLAATVAAMALSPLPASAAPSNGPDPPILNGEAFVGKKLSADIGAYTFYGCGGGGKGPDFTVYWTRDGFLVAGETSRSYLLEPDDTAPGWPPTSRPAERPAAENPCTATKPSLLAP